MVLEEEARRCDFEECRRGAGVTTTGAAGGLAEEGALLEEEAPLVVVVVGGLGFFVSKEDVEDDAP